MSIIRRRELLIGLGAAALIRPSFGAPARDRGAMIGQKLIGETFDLRFGPPAVVIVIRDCNISCCRFVFDENCILSFRTNYAEDSSFEGLYNLHDNGKGSEMISNCFLNCSLPGVLFRQSDTNIVEGSGTASPVCAAHTS